MRVILDTNVLVSAIFTRHSLPDRLLDAWYRRKFTLLSSSDQIVEIKRISQYPHLAPRLAPWKVGRLINDLREVATIVTGLPLLDVSTDPFDNFLLAMAEKGQADLLVTGDKSDVLSLGKHRSTRIVSVRSFAEILGL